jgi:CRISPR/Cas system-associated protein Cas7 (RAMP superfamily)
MAAAANFYSALVNLDYSPVVEQSEQEIRSNIKNTIDTLNSVNEQYPNIFSVFVNVIDKMCLKDCVVPTAE